VHPPPLNPKLSASLYPFLLCGVSLEGFELRQGREARSSDWSPGWHTWWCNVSVAAKSVCNAGWTSGEPLVELGD